MYKRCLELCLWKRNTQPVNYYQHRSSCTQLLAIDHRFSQMITSTVFTAFSLAALSSGVVHAAPTFLDQGSLSGAGKLAVRGGPPDQNYDTEWFWIGKHSFNGGQEWDVAAPMWFPECKVAEGHWPNAENREDNCAWYRLNFLHYKICDGEQNVTDGSGKVVGQCHVDGSQARTIECDGKKLEVKSLCQLTNHELQPYEMFSSGDSNPSSDPSLARRTPSATNVAK